MSGEFGKAIAQMVKTKMPQEQLEEHIANTLKKVTMCTLCTSRDDSPRGTPLEYFSDGLTLYISPDPGVKTKNLKVNPNVSVSIYNSVHPDWENDWLTLWAMQITGKGLMLKDDDPEYEHAQKLFRFEEFYRALGVDDAEWQKGRLILKVTPSKIELREYALMTEGFDRRQVWQAEV
ncbi:pyridoxamine 5'-phosphate oxidase family protein [Chloroflexota bacterium]